MKKITYLGIIGLFLSFGSCKKENDSNPLPSQQNKQSSQYLKSNKFDLTHNGKTINVNENAVYAHLQHGDIFGSADKNIIAQGVIVSGVPLSQSSSLFVSLSNTSDYQNYNSSLFGVLDLNNMMLFTDIFNRQAIYIPALPDTTSEFINMLIAYVSPSGNGFLTIAARERKDQITSTQVDNLFSVKMTGVREYYLTGGELIISMTLDNNQIVDLYVNPNGSGFPGRAGPFADCYAKARADCYSNFPCELANLVFGGGIPFAIGTAIDCAMSTL